MHKFLLISVLMGLTLVSNVYAEEKFRRLKAAEIKALIVGKTITDDYHWADIFNADGTVGGHQLGEAQTGSWKLTKSGQICAVRVTSHKPKNLEPDCVDIWLRGDEIQYRQGSIVLSEGILKKE